MQDNRKGNVWVWVGIAVVVIVLIVFFVWRPGSKPLPPGSPVYAPQGQVVAGFPQNLVLDTAAQISNSYSINYSTSTDQYTAEWSSTNSVSAETTEYQNYLQANGWKVTPNIVRVPTIRALSASNGNATLLVNMVTQGTGSQVTVTYVTR